YRLADGDLSVAADRDLAVPANGEDGSGTDGRRACHAEKVAGLARGGDRGSWIEDRGSWIVDREPPRWSASLAHSSQPRAPKAVRPRAWISLRSTTDPLNPGC